VSRITRNAGRDAGKAEGSHRSVQGEGMQTLSLKSSQREKNGEQAVSRNSTLLIRYEKTKKKKRSTVAEEKVTTQSDQVLGVKPSKKV